MAGNFGRALNTAIPNIIQNVSNIEGLQERAKRMRMEEELQPYRLKGLEQSTALNEIALQQRTNELARQKEAMTQLKTPRVMQDVLGVKNFENFEGAKDVIQEYYKDFQSWGGATSVKGIDNEVVGYTTTQEKYAQYITQQPDRPIVYLQQSAFRMADAAKNKRAELNELQLKGGNENKIAQLTAEIKQLENGQAFALGRASFIAKQSGLEKDEDFEPAGEGLANLVNEKAGKPIISAGSPRGWAMKLAKELGMGQAGNLKGYVDQKGNFAGNLPENHPDVVSGKVMTREDFTGLHPKVTEDNLKMSDVTSAFNIELNTIKNQMMLEMTPEETQQLAGQPAENVLAMLLSGRIGKAIPKEKRDYYLAKLKETNDYYTELSQKVLGRKGVTESKPESKTKYPEGISGVPKRLQGESIEDYLKRTGK